MIFEGFKLHATPTIHEAYCTNKRCKKKPELVEVSNGMLSIALFCTECKSVYLLKLVREPKVPKEFLQQCLNEVERDNRKRAASHAFNEVLEKRKEIERNNLLNKAKKYAKKNK